MKNGLLQCDFGRSWRIRGLFILVAVVGLLFLWPNASPVYAIGVSDLKQLDYSVSRDMGYHFGQSLGTGINGSFSELALYFSTGNFNGLKIKICEGNTLNSFFGDGNEVALCPTLITSSTLTANTSVGLHILDFGQTYDFNASKYYSIVFNNGSSAGEINVYGSATSTSFVNGSGEYESAFGKFFCLNSSGNNICNYPYSFYYQADPVKDMYFQFDPPPTTSEIQIDFPENATSTLDFNAFIASGYSLIQPFTIHLVWGTSSSTFTGQNVGVFDFDEDFEVGILKSSILELDTTYYARAQLLECPPEYYAEGCLVLSPNDVGVFDVLATSPVISFTIIGENPELGGYLHIPTSTSTEIVLTCDPNDNWFQQSICYGFQAMLKPKQEDWDRFNNLGIALQNKAPIGYFTAIKTSLTGIATTTSLAFSLTTSTAALAPILTPLRIGITFILWLAFGFWVFHRIRKLEL